MTAPIAPDERVTLRALADAATEGPWEATQDKRWGAIASGPDAVIYAYTAHASTCEGCDCGGHGAADIEIRAEDAEFIAAARTAVPRLLDALDAAEAEVERLRAHLGDCHCDKNPATTDGPEEDCPQHGRPLAEVWDIVVKAQGERDEALAEVERLRAIREHLPTRPNRETVARALKEHGGWTADLSDDEMDCCADAVLALLPGRSEAEVLAPIRAALANHPTCDIHPDDDPVTCGWKRAVHDIQTALDGDHAALRSILAYAWDEGMAYGVNYDAGDYEVAPEPIENPYREGENRE